MKKSPDDWFEYELTELRKRTISIEEAVKGLQKNIDDFDIINRGTLTIYTDAWAVNRERQLVTSHGIPKPENIDCSTCAYKWRNRQTLKDSLERGAPF